MLLILWSCFCSSFPLRLSMILTLWPLSGLAFLSNRWGYCTRGEDTGGTERQLQTLQRKSCCYCSVSTKRVGRSGHSQYSGLWAPCGQVQGSNESLEYVEWWLWKRYVHILTAGTWECGFIWGGGGAGKSLCWCNSQDEVILDYPGP